MPFAVGQKVRIKSFPPGQAPSTAGTYIGYITQMEKIQGQLFTVSSVRRKGYFLGGNSCVWLECWLEAVPTRKINLRPKCSK